MSLSHCTGLSVPYPITWSQCPIPHYLVSVSQSLLYWSQCPNPYCTGLSVPYPITGLSVPYPVTGLSVPVPAVLVSLYPLCWCPGPGVLVPVFMSRCPGPGVHVPAFMSRCPGPGVLVPVSSIPWSRCPGPGVIDPVVPCPVVQWCSGPVSRVPWCSGAPVPVHPVPHTRYPSTHYPTTRSLPPAGTVSAACSKQPSGPPGFLWFEPFEGLTTSRTRY